MESQCASVAAMVRQLRWRDWLGVSIDSQLALQTNTLRFNTYASLRRLQFYNWPRCYGSQPAVRFTYRPRTYRPRTYRVCDNNLLQQFYADLTMPPLWFELPTAVLRADRLMRECVRRILLE